jgi:hypothetical protein
VIGTRLIYAGSGDYVLTLGRTGHQIVTEEHRVARGRAASVGAAGPVRIGVNNKVGRRRAMQSQAKGKSTL